MSYQTLKDKAGYFFWGIRHRHHWWMQNPFRRVYYRLGVCCYEGPAWLVFFLKPRAPKQVIDLVLNHSTRVYEYK